MTNAQTRQGSCLCGAVRFEVSGPMRDILICHCSQCRRQHGHAAAFTNAPKEKFRFMEHRGLAWYRSSDGAERGFCRECGSNLFWRRLNAPTMSVTPGSLENPTGLTCSAHVFTAWKGDYYGLPEDGLTRYAEWQQARR